MSRAPILIDELEDQEKGDKEQRQQLHSVPPAISQFKQEYQKDFKNQSEAI